MWICFTPGFSSWDGPRLQHFVYKEQAQSLQGPHTPNLQKIYRVFQYSETFLNLPFRYF